MPLTAVLIDLDDTLIDGRGVEDEALVELGRDVVAELPDVALDDLWARFRATRERHYVRLLAGEWDVERYRREHFADALAPWGVPSEALLTRGNDLRRELPERSRLAAGALDLVRGLRERGLRTGLLTNGPSQLQRHKLDLVGLESELDAIGVSEELGAAKPDRAAFDGVLDLLGVRADETAMVGDSLDNDVRGALDAGLAGAVWIRVDPDDDRAAPPGVPVFDGLAGVLTALQR